MSQRAKNFAMNQILKLLIRYPKLMQSSPLIKLISNLAERMGRRYDDIIADGHLYRAPFEEGLTRLCSTTDRPVRRALDIGTGTGFVALQLARAFPGADVTGVDLSESMLQAAERKASEAQLNNVRFVRQNAFDTAFEDDTFSLVAASNAPFCLDEIARVLSTGGRFLFALSWGGRTLSKSEDRVKRMLRRYGFDATEIAQVAQGAFVLSTLKD